MLQAAQLEQWSPAADFQLLSSPVSRSCAGGRDDGKGGRWNRKAAAGVAVWQVLTEHHHKLHQGGLSLMQTTDPMRRSLHTFNVPKLKASFINNSQGARTAGPI